MKISIILAVASILTIISYESVPACTSFSVTSKDRFYGMNFDYKDTEIVINVFETRSGNMFNLAFKYGDRFLNVTAMNSRGLFIATQIQQTRVEYVKNASLSEMYIGDIGPLALEQERTSQITQALKGKSLAPVFLPIHHFVADRYGSSLIIETGDTDKNILTCTPPFAIMTNFRNIDYKDSPYFEVSGLGSDRYMIAYEYLKKNQSSFDMSKAWELLEKTAQITGNSPTQCSMVFQPVEGIVHLSLKHDFSRVYRLSLSSRTIEAEKGFKKKITIGIPTEGFAGSAIQKKFDY